MSWTFPVWVATATNGTKQAFSVVLYPSPFQPYLWLTVSVLLPHLSIIFASMSCSVVYLLYYKFYHVILQSAWPRNILFLFSVESPWQNHSFVFLTVCATLSLHLIIFIFTCIFFSVLFFLRTSVLLIHKSLQEEHTDWKPLSSGRMVNCFHYMNQISWSLQFYLGPLLLKKTQQHPKPNRQIKNTFWEWCWK